MTKNFDNLEAVGSTISSLENKDQEVNFEQFQSAVNTAETELDSSESINAKQKKAIKRNVDTALDDIGNEQNRQFLLCFLHWCMKQLISQQQGRLMVSPVSAFPATPYLSPLSENEDRRRLGAAGNRSHDAFTRYLLQDALNGGRGYIGSVITRSSNDGSPTPYIAYHSPNGNVTITGDYQEGWKDMTKLYQAAGVSSLAVGSIDAGARNFLA